MYFYSFMDIFLYLYRYVVENSDILVEKKDAVQGRAFKCDYTHYWYTLLVFRAGMTGKKRKHRQSPNPEHEKQSFFNWRGDIHSEAEVFWLSL